MIPLNLPKSEFNLKRENSTVKIFDILRHRFVKLTPEEWVRQNFVSYLINHLGYPKGLIGNEVSVEVNGAKRRCDTIVADPTGAPLMIIEYKSPDVEITQEVFSQICSYNLIFKAKYLMVTNGLNHYCCMIEYKPLIKYIFLEDIPAYNKL